MTYSLEFKTSALKEWKKLGNTTREQFKKKLKERLNHPRAPKDQLSGYPGCYKIKLASSGYRLVYQVNDTSVTVTVVAVGKRERSLVYQTLKKHL